MIYLKRQPSNIESEVIMMMGVADAGKSTAIQQIMKTSNKEYIVICPDEYRKKIAGDYLQTHDKEVFAQVRLDLEEAIRKGKNVIYDATNISNKKRKAMFGEFKRFNKGATIRLVYVKKTLDTILKQNAQREGLKVVPTHRVIQMFGYMCEPTYAEGCDIIQIYHEDGSVETLSK